MSTRWFMILITIALAAPSCRERHSPDETLRQHLYVHREMSEEPVPGARILLFRESRSTKPFAEAITDERGHAVITARYGDARPSPKANWYIVASADGYSTCVTNGSTVFRKYALLLPMRKINQE